MPEKPTYEELLRKVRKFEKQAVEHDLVEASLRENEAALKSIFRAAPTGIGMVADRVIQRANDRLCELTGYSREELLGKSARILYPTDKDFEFVGREKYAQIKKHGTGTVETRWQRKNGTIINVLLSSTPIDPNNLSAGVTFTALDITEQVQAEMALRESEKFLNDVFNSIQDGISILGADLTVQRVNDVMKQWYAKNLPLEGKKCHQCYHDKDEPCDPCPTIRCIASGRVEREIVPGLSGSSAKWIELFSYPVKDHHTDEVTGVVEFVRDITERIASEEALQKSEKRYRLLADNVKDVIWTRDLDLNLTYISPSVQDLMGFTTEEAMARAPEEIWPPDSLKRYVEILAEELEIEKGEEKDLSRSRTIEAKVKRKDESTVWTEARMSFLRSPDGHPTGIIGVTRDITERKKMEAALQQSEERYRSLVENTMFGFSIIEIPSGRFLFLNQRICDLYGYTMQEGLQLTVWDTLSKGDHEPLQRRIRERLEGENPDPDLQTYTAVRKDGSTFRIEVSSSLIIFQGKTAIQGILRDVTESERLEQQLKQAQKMEALGTLAGGIAHDFNNLLMGIQGRASLMLMDRDASLHHVEHLKGIEEYVKSAADLTRQLLGLSRSGKYEVKPTDLNTLIKNENRMFGRTRKEINIQEKLENHLWTVEVDQRQIEQMLLNIYINAWQAMPAGGDLYIQTTNMHIDQEYGKLYHTEPGRYVKISITDTGVGMDEATRLRIFDPFFTTKEMGRGTGLGLASVYGIIKNHNGFIDVQSEKGKGTIFNIYLPASEKEVAKEEAPDEELVTGEGGILLVDDEDMILNVGAGIIEKLGYTVYCAKSGKEAINIYEENQGRIDMVILDMIMPEMGGGETYDRLKKIDPDIKVLLSSGYSINGQATEIMERGCDGFIQKPFNVTNLSKKIRKILDGEQGISA